MSISLIHELCRLKCEIFGELSILSKISKRLDQQLVESGAQLFLIFYFKIYSLNHPEISPLSLGQYQLEPMINAIVQARLLH